MDERELRSCAAGFFDLLRFFPSRILFERPTRPGCSAESVQATTHHRSTRDRYRFGAARPPGPTSGCRWAVWVRGPVDRFQKGPVTPVFTWTVLRCRTGRFLFFFVFFVLVHVDSGFFGTSPYEDDFQFKWGS